MTAAGAWIPATPLPMLGWRTDRCRCGRRFSGKNRAERYEYHWHQVHASQDDGQAMMLVSSEKAYALGYRPSTV